MTNAQKELWIKIRDFDLDEPSADYSFTDRLARENNWPIEYSLRTIVEYKKFMFLLCMAKNPLTPSDQIDQVWHLHLIYTRSYWKEFCGQILCKEIHHDPTNGGLTEQNKFENWYEKTKELYANTFKVLPPNDIWPSSESRFSQIDFIRVNRNQHWIIKKPNICIQ